MTASIADYHNLINGAEVRNANRREVIVLARQHAIDKTMLIQAIHNAKQIFLPQYNSKKFIKDKVGMGNAEAIQWDFLDHSGLERPIPFDPSQLIP